MVGGMGNEPAEACYRMWHDRLCLTMKLHKECRAVLAAQNCGLTSLQTFQGRRQFNFIADLSGRDDRR